MSNNLGMGVMLAMLGGNEDSAKAFAAATGKTIKSLRLGDDEALHFEFEDGSRIRLFDDGQSCCESRYMRTDDDLAYYVGATLTGARIQPAAEKPEHEYSEHEIEFLIVDTDRGSFTMASHNEHNGYYGGFALRAASE